MPPIIPGDTPANSTTRKVKLTPQALEGLRLIRVATGMPSDAATLHLALIRGIDSLLGDPRWGQSGVGNGVGDGVVFGPLAPTGDLSEIGQGSKVGSSLGSGMGSSLAPAPPHTPPSSSSPIGEEKKKKKKMLVSSPSGDQPKDLPPAVQPSAETERIRVSWDETHAGLTRSLAEGWTPKPKAREYLAWLGAQEKDHALTAGRARYLIGLAKEAAKWTATQRPLAAPPVVPEEKEVVPGVDRPWTSEEKAERVIWWDAQLARIAKAAEARKQAGHIQAAKERGWM